VAELSLGGAKDVMGHTGGDRAGVRVALPAGWIELQPAETDAHVGGDLVQLATVARWAGHVVRPTLSVAVTPPSAEPIASRVLADARARVAGVRVLAIDPWKVAGARATGRRLVFSHLVGDVTVTTLVWAVATTVGNVLVTARSEGTELHVHDRAFTEAVAGLTLPDAVGFSGATESNELFGRALAPAWSPVDAGAGTTMMADPHARILVEASVGRTSLRFDATLARDFATVWATASPRAITTAAERADGSRAGATTFRVPPTRLALTIAEWLGLGPSLTHMQPVTLPLSVVMSRLLDPCLPAPEGMDAATWAQPWFLWTLRSSATDSGLVIVDTAGCGQVAVMEGEDEQATRFSPLSSYNVWLTLNWLVNESLVRR
jgi:hypothetical protein